MGQGIVRKPEMDMDGHAALFKTHNQLSPTTQLSVPWQPGRAGSLGEGGRTYAWLGPFAVHLTLLQRC